MAQSGGEFKLNSDVSPKVVSRDFKVRTLEETSANHVSAGQQIIVDEKTNRREMMKSIIPASGKVLTVFLRSVSTGVSEVLEKLESPSKKISK